jgi:hypothetical protein
MSSYGSKDTGFVSESRFIDFYRDNTIKAYGIKNIWNNLSNAGYRSDFSKKTEPIKPLRE